MNFKSLLSSLHSVRLLLVTHHYTGIFSAALTMIPLFPSRCVRRREQLDQPREQDSKTVMRLGGCAEHLKLTLTVLAGGDAFRKYMVDLTSPITLERQDLVKRVLVQNEHEKFSLMRCPPGTGKTALLQLIARELARKEIPHSYHPITQGYNGFVLLNEFIEQLPRESNEQVAYLLLDEIQILYGDVDEDGQSFWTRFLKTGCRQLPAIHQGLQNQPNLSCLKLAALGPLVLKH